MNMRGLPKFSANIFPTDLKTGTSGAIELNIWLAQMSGLPILGLKKETQRLKVLLLLYGVPITLLVTFLYLGFEMWDLTQCWPSLDDMTQNSCLSLTHLGGTYKIMNTFYRLTDISKVVEKLKTLTRNFISTPKQRVAYIKDEKLNKTFLIGYATLVGFTGVLAIFMLYYDPENVAGKAFPYHIYLPDWLPYHIRMAYMGFGVTLFAMQIVSVDYLNINMINQIRFHLNALNLRFEELIVSKKVHDNSTNIANKRNANDPNDILRTITEHHESLKSLCDDIEDIYRVPVLMQFATSLSIFALTGFQATVQNRDTNGAVLIYFYCCCIFCELFFYCWFGNEVFEQNKTLAITGYNCSWYEFDSRFKKSMLIFLTNAQRPVLFTAGGFMNLFLPSFAGILGKAYTYVAVLRQVYGK